ncbi:efflux RND transporter permease subunit [Rhodoferax sediminis]|uniref:Efflux RND transporter permease subunit n=1 Tax=Rhodoferax sediminis TaxID=2509614 RepID=A0A515D7M8_9BURK|nr:efflux RND transporter permease subunit [Rhodoferax sediminis]QDL36409.1 efflux RND transporter permease subunit [Rhodoferax sediminis]
MLTSLVRTAIRLRGVVIALSCLLAGYGFYVLFQSRLDVFPEFAPPLAIVHTQAPGLSSEQVETLVTQPIENSLGGTLGLQTMQSKSLQALSVVSLTFDAGTDIYRARQLVAERLGNVAGALPPGVKPPALLPLTSSTGVAMVIGLTSREQPSMVLRDAAQWTVKPRLLGVPGVADVIIFGGDVRQFQIEVDPQKLLAYGLQVSDVLEAARRSTGVRGGGYVESANQRIVVHSEGQITSVEELAQAVVAERGGVSVHLGDVARVAIGAAPVVGGASIGDQPGLMMVIESQYGADPMLATEAVERVLSELKPALDVQHIVLHPDIFRPADFITASIDHLRTALLMGGAMVVAVLFLFLLDVRTAFISATAIPLSLLTAVVVLHHLGVSLNTMTLGGLAIALGEVVDDAIVDVENIFRRLRENQALSTPLAPARVVLKASVEVRGAVVFATFIVALIFLPVLTLSGVAGKLFAPLGIAYILAILASLGVALTVTPALAYILLTRRPLQEREPRLIGALKARYGLVLTAVEHRPKVLIAALAILCMLALAIIPFFSTSFIPDLKEGHYTVHMATAPGTSLTESMRIGREVSVALAKIPGVRLVAQRAGRAEDVVDPVGVNISEFEVALKPMSGAGQERARSDVIATLARFPGLTTSANTFLKERIDETISGYTAPVIVNVFGDDLDVLDSKAQEIAQVLGGIPGAIGVTVQSPPGTPQMVVRLRAQQLSRFGFRSVDVLEAIQTAFEGVAVAQVFQGTRAYDVTVRLGAGVHGDPAGVGALLLRNPQGLVMPLRELADIRQSDGRYQIQHRGGQRLQTVTTNVTGRAVGDFVKVAQAQIASKVAFPRGTYAVFAGEAQAQAQSRHDLLVNTGIAAVAIVLLLFVALRSTRGLMLVLVNLPFALVGGVLTVLLTGGNLTLGSLVGFVTLFGITLRNSIMLVSHYEHLVHSEGMLWGLEAARRGASERLIPILMTALVTALGLLPLALSSAEPGNEIEGPMAIVILGGLVTSTVLNLLALPVLAARFGRFNKKPV